jgi:outer membrane protein OmpA-like peptidoglycan-associated protein
MEVLVVGAVMALLIHFGQEAPSPRAAQETVVLLPGPDGHVGTVIVTRGERRRILNQAYATTRAMGPREVAFEVRTSEAVRSEFGEVLAALPVRPASFTVYFGSGVDELVFEPKGELEQALDELARRAQSDIVLIGHTDRVGTDESNDRLSLQRAQRIQVEMMTLGIAPGRVQVAGRGEREPVVPTADGVEEPRNRRVEIIIR